MEFFKVDHFVRENPGIPFPRYDSLSQHECEDIRRQVTKKLRLPDEVKDVVLVSRLAEVQKASGYVNAEDSEFDLQDVVSLIGVEPENALLVNWRCFDDIDRFTLSDLAKFFNDIWYPASDDIDVFDSTLSWIISVTHDGHVQYVTFGSSD